MKKRQEAVRQALATFEKVAREWHAHATELHEWSESYSQKILRQLELYAFPKLGRHPINTLSQMDVLQCLEAVSLAGTRETAIRLRESLQRVYARAVTVGVLEPGKNFMAKSVADFKLRTPRVKHYATMLDPEKIDSFCVISAATRATTPSAALCRSCPTCSSGPARYA
ncbi:phage-related integrase [Bordetella ansorpii]|uniref:Phage-related integrase n=1 Tax=Bordetella ansorpii TaxID=288768 RepID=A0A157SAN4_9BORD|nr:hypothetical protein [Bordetella ansorpii]SAI67497.1 phage-related integrase [Bordetella ansorpii]